MNFDFLQNLEEVTLDEYAKAGSEDASMENYTGIVLDPDKNTFKVVKGRFYDKKDFYEKMRKRGLVLRKCYESGVYEFIQKRSKSSLDAYLMLSTAISKWKNNNILGDYYVQILNEIPKLNRERLKGDPNSLGQNKVKVKRESAMDENIVLDEDSVTDKESLKYLSQKDQTRYNNLDAETKLLNNKVKQGDFKSEEELNNAINRLKAIEKEKADLTRSTKAKLDLQNLFSDFGTEHELTIYGGSVEEDENGKKKFKPGKMYNVETGNTIPAKIQWTVPALYGDEQKDTDFNGIFLNTDFVKKLEEKMKSFDVNGSNPFAYDYYMFDVDGNIKGFSKYKLQSLFNTIDVLRTAANKTTFDADRDRVSSDNKAVDKKIEDILSKYDMFVSINGHPDALEGEDRERAKELVKTINSTEGQEKHNARIELTNLYKKIDPKMTIWDKANYITDPEDKQEYIKLVKEKQRVGAASKKQQDTLDILGDKRANYEKAKNEYNSMVTALKNPSLTNEEREEYKDKARKALNKMKNLSQKAYDTYEQQQNKEKRKNSVKELEKELNIAKGNLAKVFNDELIKNDKNFAKASQVYDDTDKADIYSMDATDSEELRDKINKVKDLENRIAAKKKVASNMDELEFRAENPISPPNVHGEGDSDAMFINMLSNRMDLQDKLKAIKDIKDKKGTVKLKLPKALPSDYLNSQQTKAKSKEFATKPEETDVNFTQVALDAINDKFAQDNNIPDHKGTMFDKRITKDEVITKAYKDFGNETGIPAKDRSEYFLNNQEEYKQRLAKAFEDLLNPQEEVDEAVVNDGVRSMHQDSVQAGANMYGEIAEAQTHEMLHPGLFENEKLKPEIKDALLEIATKFCNSLEVPLEPIDIYFTGSCANYNYNDTSDIDLHLVFDYENAGINADLFKKYLKSAKNVFNNKYNITIKGIPVEVGAENKNEPLVTTGIYSLAQDQWIKLPENKGVEYNDVDLPYYENMVNTIEDAIQSQDVEKIEALIKVLGMIRKESLKSEGEFGIGNLLFKKLRAEQFLQRLRDAYYQVTSKELSIEGLE